MTEQQKAQALVFSQNLNRIMAERGVRQIDVAKAIGVNKSTFSTWVNGISIPRMDKVQKLADYFGILKSDLVDDSDNYDLEDAIEKAFRTRPEMRMLFSVAEGCSKEDIENAIKIISALKK